ncbi:MAG: hypothetical protein AAF219_11190 [Myxococcota bacterium]
MSLMAQLIGEFDLSPELEDAITARSPVWLKQDSRPGRFLYKHRDGILDVGGGYQFEPFADERIPGETIVNRVLIGFHLDTARALEGGTVALECALRIMPLVDENLAFFTNDYVKLARRNSALTLFRLVPENDFWDIPGRVALVPEPYEWVKLPTPGWYNERERKK